MEKNDNIRTATSAERSELFKSQVEFKALVEYITLVLYFPFISSSVSISLDKMSQVFQAGLSSSENTNSIHLSSNKNSDYFLLKWFLAFISTLITLKLLKALSGIETINFCSEKISYIFKFFFSSSQRTQLLSGKEIINNKKAVFSNHDNKKSSEADLTITTLIEALALNYQSKNLTSKEAAEAIKIIERKTSFFLDILKIVIIGALIFGPLAIQLLGLNPVSMRSQILHSMWLLAYLNRQLILQKPGPVTKSKDQELKKHLTLIHQKAFSTSDACELLIPPVLSVARIIRNLTAPVLYSFKRPNNDFFAHIWGEELEKIGFKIIGADSNEIIFIRTKNVQFNKSLEEQLIASIKRKANRIEEINKKLKNLFLFLKHLAAAPKKLLFDFEAKTRNWYYVNNVGPDAYFSIQLNENSLANDEWDNLKRQINSLNTIFISTDNMLIIKSLYQFDLDNFKQLISSVSKESSHLNETEFSQKALLNIEDKRTKANLKYLYRQQPHFKIKSTCKYSSVQWNFTNYPIITADNDLEVEKVVYANFKLLGEEYRTSINKLNRLNQRNENSNVWLFFDSNAKPIKKFKKVHPVEYHELAELAKQPETCGEHGKGIKKVKDSDKDFYKSEKYKDMGVWKVKGNSGKRLFGYEIKPKREKIAVHFSDGSETQADAIIRICDVKMKHKK